MNRDRFVSNTLAASANQLYFDINTNEQRTGRVYYRVQCGGTFPYTFHFQNTIDSTYADGTISRHDLPCGTWEIVRAAVARCRDVDPMQATDFVPLTFDGAPSKTVSPDEKYVTDPVTLSFDKHDYLCLEITFRGTRLPYHEESILPLFTETADGWVADKRMPLPYLIGCERAIKRKIAFFGDSITQGVGTTPNAYAHWNACLADALGDGYAYHNLGIGYGRAADAASGGVWFEKALASDVVFVCFGVNDILQGATADAVIASLSTIIDTLKAAGKTVILQTVPPFDYDEAKRAVWHAVNRCIQKDLSRKVDHCFDSVPILGQDIPCEHIARYGGHPNDEGCAVWAAALYEALCRSDWL